MHGFAIAPDSNNLAVALAMAAAGLPIFPAKVTFNEKKQKWEKEPHVKGWQQEATTDEQKLRDWWGEWPDAVPAIELGRAGLIMIDTDRHGRGDGVANFAELVAQHVPLPEHPIAKTAGDGEHHYFRQWNGETFGNSEGALRGKDINVRGAGGCAIAPGARRPDGKRWAPAGLTAAYHENKIPLLPDWIAAMIRVRKPETPAKPTNGAAPLHSDTHHDRPAWSAAEEARVRDALAHIPSEDRTTWFEVGAALHHTGWSAARAMWDAWSQTTPGAYDAADQEKTWRSFDRPYAGAPKTLGSLFHLAQMNGFALPNNDASDDAATPAPPREKSGQQINQPVDLFDPWGRYVVPPCPLEVLPATLRHFVTAQSELIGCERGALAMTVLAAVSGALDHRFALKMLRNGDWWVSPRLWVLLVGDPSVKKTPIIRCATEQLDRMQAVAFRKYKEDRAEYLAAGGDPEQFRAPPPRLTVYDTTIEKLGMILAEQDRGVLVKRDEIAGWIGSMEKYASGGRGSAADRAFWLQSYDGGPYSVDRVTRPDLQITNLSASIIGGIQPARLAELQGLASDGLLQRFLPVLISTAAFPTDTSASIYADRYAGLLHHLVELAPQKLLLSDEAVKLMGQLRRDLFDLEQNASGLTAGFATFVGKLAGNAGTLALILTMAAEPDRPPSTSIGPAVVEDVATLIKGFVLPHALEFYASGASGGERLRTLASWILTSGKTRIVPSDISTNVRDCRGLGIWDINQRVSPLVAGGWLMPDQPGPIARWWSVNPQIAAQFAARAEDEKRRKAAVAALMNAPHATVSRSGT